MAGDACKTLEHERLLWELTYYAHDTCYIGYVVGQGWESPGLKGLCLQVLDLTLIQSQLI